MTVKVLTKNHLEYLSLKGGCTGSSECIHVKMSHCWKSHVAAHFNNIHIFYRMGNKLNGHNLLTSNRTQSFSYTRKQLDRQMSYDKVLNLQILKLNQVTK